MIFNFGFYVLSFFIHSISGFLIGFVVKNKLPCFFLLIGLAFATLIPFHDSPQVVFQAEWSLALAVVVGMFVWIGSDKAEPLLFRTGEALWGILLLMAICLVWLTVAPGLAYVVYSGLLLMCYLQGSGLKSHRFADVVALGMFVCALAQSLTGLAQLLGVSFGGLIVPYPLHRVSGNINQANHYADLIFIGLGSLSFLYARRFLKTWWMVLFSVWLSLAAAASASRVVWGYMAVFVMLGVWAIWRGDGSARRSGRVLLVVAACSLVAQLVWSYGQVLDVFGVTSSLNRASDGSLYGIRVYIWKAALMAIQEYPWLGQGPGPFYKSAVQAMFVTAPESFSKFAEHAHNLPLSLMVEFGIPFSLLIMGAFGLWCVRHLLRPATMTSVWCLAVIGVIGSHSMVEYPLWFAYFLVPFGLCMGFADADDGRLSLIKIPRWVGMLPCMIALGVLICIEQDWFAVKNAFWTQYGEEPKVSMPTRMEVRAELAKISRFSVFNLKADTLRLQSWSLEEGGAEEAAARCDAQWSVMPDLYMMMRCGDAYAVTQKEVSLDKLIVALCEGFPSSYNRTVLREWATGFDAENHQGLKISGRNCL